MKINKCSCGATPKEMVSEMFRDCTNNYHIECPVCGYKSITENFSYYNRDDESFKKENVITDWNNKQ